MSFAGPRGQTSRRQLLLLASLSAVSAATSACSDAKTGPQEPRHSPATAYPGGTGPTDQASATTGAGAATAPREFSLWARALPELPRRSASSRPE